MASKCSAEQIELLLADAFKTVMKASRETVRVEQVFNPDADHTSAQDHVDDDDEMEDNVDATEPLAAEDLTTLPGMRAVVAKVLKKTLKEVRKTARVEYTFNPKANEQRLRAVSKIITATDRKRLKINELPISHFLKHNLGVAHKNYNTYKIRFQKALKERKIQQCIASGTFVWTRSAYGSLVMVYTQNDLELMKDVLREVNGEMANHV